MFKKNDEQSFFSSNNGEIKFRIEQKLSVHLKAITKHNDPVEISAEEAIEISEKPKAFLLKILTNEN